MFDEQIVGVRNPLHARDVVVARIARNSEPARVASRGADDSDTNGRVRGASDGVGDVEALRIFSDAGIRKACDDFAGRAEIVEQWKDADAGGVELPIRDLT